MIERPKDRETRRAGPRLHLRLDLGFRKALQRRAELAAQGLAEPDAAISLGRSSRLSNYPDDELEEQG